MQGHLQMSERFFKSNIAVSILRRNNTANRFQSLCGENTNKLDAYPLVGKTYDIILDFSLNS